jgi:ABC-2 type transport system ATP-binding protein
MVAAAAAARKGTPTMTEQAGWVVAAGLTKRFGAVTAVDGLSFSARPGSVTGFLGPNGAGKTTTLRMMLGLITPDAGHATIGGVRYADLPEPGRVVGAVLETAGFHPSRSGRDHLLVYCTACGYPPRRADEVLELAGLAGAGRRKVRGYSLGMRQRLALATALLGDPSVLLLDEPANGLDPEGIAWLRGLLGEYARDGRTVIFSSHALPEVEQLADQVIIVSAGRLAGQGTVAELATGSAAVSVRTAHPDELTSALRAAGGSAQPAGRGRLGVTGLAAADISRIARQHSIDLDELVTGHGDLERVYLKLTAASEGQAATQRPGLAQHDRAGEQGGGPA